MNSKSEQSVQDHVVENYERLRYQLRYARHYHDWWLQDLIALADPDLLAGTILDNGCGPGTLQEFMFADYDDLIGLDLSYGMLRKTHQYSGNYLQGDSNRLPFADNTFDLILARSLLHHLPDPSLGIQEMHRVLKTGGQVVLTDTNKSLLSDLPRRIAYKGDNFSDDHQNFNRDDYLGWLEACFEIEKVKHFGYLAYPFGFPDMMGKLAQIPYPIWLVTGLITIDEFIRHIPIANQQSWGIHVVVRKTRDRIP
ncbi:MAG: class I SAM-dependent methyltransferase [Anaerolineae bacterium]